MMKRSRFIWIGLAILFLSGTELSGSPLELASEGPGNMAFAALEVRGRVVDECGHAGAGCACPATEIAATLRAQSRDSAEASFTPSPRCGVKTSADGGYALTVPAAGMWQVEIAAKGKVPLRRKLVPLLESGFLPQAQLMEDAGVDLLVVDGEGRTGGRVADLDKSTSR